MKSLKHHLKQIPIIGPAARWINSRITQNWKIDPSHWIAHLTDPQNAQIVQIGSNDGKTGDPLFQLFQRFPAWRALFVEPVPFLFERLKKNYPDTERFRFENTLINNGEKISFYWLDESAKEAIDDLPDWYDQLGSFNRSHITKHLPRCETYIKETEIAGLTLSELFNKHQIKKLSVLHIDTEGADFQILSQLDLATIQPNIILFERKHLTSDEQSDAVKFLSSLYFVFNMGDDILAIRKLADPKVESTVKSLRKFRIQ